MTDEYTEAAQKLFDAYDDIIGKAAEGIVEKDDNITFKTERSRSLMERNRR